MSCHVGCGCSARSVCAVDDWIDVGMSGTIDDILARHPEYILQTHRSSSLGWRYAVLACPHWSKCSADACNHRCCIRNGMLNSPCPVTARVYFESKRDDIGVLRVGYIDGMPMEHNHGSIDYERRRADDVFSTCGNSTHRSMMRSSKLSKSFNGSSPSSRASGSRSLSSSLMLPSLSSTISSSSKFLQYEQQLIDKHVAIANQYDSHKISSDVCHAKHCALLSEYIRLILCADSAVSISRNVVKVTKCIDDDFTEKEADVAVCRKTSITDYTTPSAVDLSLSCVVKICLSISNLKSAVSELKSFEGTPSVIVVFKGRNNDERIENVLEQIGIDTRYILLMPSSSSTTDGMLYEHAGTGWRARKCRYSGSLLQCLCAYISNILLKSNYIVRNSEIFNHLRRLCDASLDASLSSLGE